MAFENIKRFFSTEWDTTTITDNPKYKLCSTHYYVASYEKAKSAVSSVGQSNLHLKLINTDDHYHEILLEGKTGTVIVTIINISAWEVAIDMKYKIHRLIGANRPMKYVSEFYEYINKRLTLKRLESEAS